MTHEREQEVYLRALAERQKGFRKSDDVVKEWVKQDCHPGEQGAVSRVKPKVNVNFLF